MRRLIVSLCSVGALLVTALPADAGDLPPGCRPGGPTGVICDGEDDDQPGPDDDTPSPTNPNVALRFILDWDDAAAENCRRLVYVDLGRPATPDDSAGAIRNFIMLADVYPLECDDNAVPIPTPEDEARAFFEEVPLPVPAPAIDPGTMLVGVVGYLETGTAPTEDFGPRATPFGDLYLTANAEVYVDWGDDFDEVDGEDGPFASSGGPYPDGDITHLFRLAGTYDIEVRMVWSADWSIGAIGGSIPSGVETTGLLADFEVTERQASVIEGTID